MENHMSEPSISDLVRGEESDAKLFLDWVTEWDRSHRELLESWAAAWAAEQCSPAVREDALHSLHVSAEYHAAVVERPDIPASGVFNVFGMDVRDLLGRSVRESVKPCRLVIESSYPSLHSNALLARFADTHQVAKVQILRAVRLLGMAEKERGWNLVAGNNPPPPLLDDAMMAPSTLADRLGRSRDAVRKALERWRLEHPQETGRGWIEVSDRREKEPKYLYRVGSVREIVLAVSSGICPAKKKSR
jgi:hypothetical protein